MCQPVVKFCSASTKPLLFVGAFSTLVLALAVGYTGCSNQAIFKDLDLSVAEGNPLALTYYFQLFAAGYLILISIFTCFAAYYDQKHSIKALAIITSINFVLAVVAILLLPHGKVVSSLFDARMAKARESYDYNDKFPAANQTTLPSSTNPSLPQATNSSSKDTSSPTSETSSQIKKDLTKAEATKIWDSIQMHGCCGWRNSTEWTYDYKPKSCCSEPIQDGEKFVCKQVDLKHKDDCACLIEAMSYHVLYIVALIALVSLYLTTVAGVSTYRTFHYNEASQNAYS